MPRPPVAAHRNAHRNEEQWDAVRPYGAWYPLVRVGHFLLMATTSCVIILAALGVLAALMLLVGTLAK